MGFEDPIANQPTREQQQKQTPKDENISVIPTNKPKEHPIFGSWTPEQGINYTPKDF
jgi:hypothetical protein